MAKKILISLITIAAVAGGVAALSAFEAHVINVTAHIENALSVPTDPINFGTVFPNEVLYKDLLIKLSDSFLGQNRVDSVSYVIKQKSKPYDPADTEYCANAGDDWQKCVDDCYEKYQEWGPLQACIIGCSIKYPTPRCYPPLCSFLSKMPDGTPPNDVGVEVPHSLGAIAFGHLYGKTDPNVDKEDNWKIDLQVPCFIGQCRQGEMGLLPPEWESKDFGCDLWIEVTGISENPQCIPTNEVCNNDLDDDCDGQVDEGCQELLLFEYYNTGDNDVNSVVDPKWEAQTFTPQISHIIKKVKIKIYRLGFPEIVSVGIRATDAEGKPIGTDLVSGTIDGNTFTTDPSGAWYDIDLGAGTILYSGVKYAIVLGNSASGWARWRVAVPSNYEGGTSLTSLDSGNTWVFCTDGGGYDTLFEEWGI